MLPYPAEDGVAIPQMQMPQVEIDPGRTGDLAREPTIPDARWKLCASDRGSTELVGHGL